jgi:membrane-bound lytic murein transglycosylase D
MTLRALNILFLFVINQCFAKEYPPANIPVPYEIKFADITFQLNDVTRALVQNEVNNLQNNQAIVQNRLEKWMLYLPIADPILKNNQIPNDFKFLMLYNKFQSSIEMSTSLEADVLWCMDETKAKDVDLVFNNLIDERKHIQTATKGAALCLKRNHVLYKNWGSTLFSHIADKKVLTALNITQKWTNNQFIQLDAVGYSPILEFLAYKIALEREFSTYRPAVQKIVYEYPYGKNKTLSKISTELRVEPASLNSYNSWLKTTNIPESECKVLVVVPAERFNEVRVLAELAQKTGTSNKELGFPVVKRNLKLAKGKGGNFFDINNKPGIMADMCDSPIELAYKADVSLSKFLEWNELKETDLLRIGQIYYLAKKDSKAPVPLHTVKEGETLWEIAQIYGVEIKSLLEYNRMENVQRLQRGRVIYLQTTRPKDKPIEYIETKDDLDEIDELVEKTNNKTNPKQPSKVETAKNPIPKEENTLAVEETKIEKPNEENAGEVKEIDINSLPLSHEIGKNKNEQKEIDINSLPLSHEIGKSREKNLNSQNNVDTKDVTKEIVKVEVKEKSKKSESYSENVKRRVIEQTDEKSARYLYHTVKGGETLYRMSVNYKVEVDDIKKLNGLSSNIIEIGDRLKIKKL